MHVGAVVAGFDPESGGGFTFENEILKALIAGAPGAKHRMTLLAPEASVPALTRAVSGTRIEVAGVPPSGNRISNMLVRELEVVRAHWRRPSPIDVAAARNGVQFIWFLSAQPQQTDLPYMTVVWDLQHRATPWFPEMSRGGVWDGREAAHRPFLQRASKVVTGTETGRAQLRNFYQVPDENILVLPHPTPSFVEETSDPVDLRVRFGLKPPFVLYPAQFWPHKNHANLVLAAALLRRQGLDVALALPGSDKGNRAFIEEIAAREGVSDLVKPLGFVSRAELVALYRESLALAYVSWCGPENLPPLEAFAMGCPVVASRIPGADEQLGDAAQFCEPGDPRSIADAIALLHTDTRRRSELLEAGKIRSKRFTPRDYVAGVLAYFDEFEAVRRCWP